MLTILQISALKNHYLSNGILHTQDTLLETKRVVFKRKQEKYVTPITNPYQLET